MHVSSKYKNVLLKKKKHFGQWKSWALLIETHLDSYKLQETILIKSKYLLFWHYVTAEVKCWPGIGPAKNSENSTDTNRCVLRQTEGMFWGFSVGPKNAAFYSCDCLIIVREITEEFENMSKLAKKTLSPI